MAIVHPVLHKNIVNRRLVAVMVTIAWCIGFVNATAFFSVARVVNGVCYGNYNWSSVVVPLSTSIFLVKMVFPMLIYATCYILTFISLKRRARKVAIAVPTAAVASYRADNSPSQPPAVLAVSMTTPLTEADMHSYSRASHNVLVTVLYTLILHVIAWTGNQVIPTFSTQHMAILYVDMHACMHIILYTVVA
jgi:7 transmembrane receptor (rhodopsin family)